MRKNEATGRIKILKTPEGEAPLWVREAWFGLIIACFPYIGVPSGELTGVLSGDELQNTRRGVIVPQATAIAELSKHDREAADWWFTNGFGGEGDYFFFFEDEIGIVSGVGEAPMRVFCDMETGRWKELQ